MRPPIGARIVRGLDLCLSVLGHEFEQGEDGAFRDFGLDEEPATRAEVDAALNYIGALISWYQDEGGNSG